MHCPLQPAALSFVGRLHQKLLHDYLKQHTSWFLAELQGGQRQLCKWIGEVIPCGGSLAGLTLLHHLGVSQDWGFPLRVPEMRILAFGVYIGFPLFWETTIWNILQPCQQALTSGPRRDATCGSLHRKGGHQHSPQNTSREKKKKHSRLVKWLQQPPQAPVRRVPRSRSPGRQGQRVARPGASGQYRV